MLHNLWIWWWKIANLNHISSFFSIAISAYQKRPTSVSCSFEEFNKIIQQILPIESLRIWRGHFDPKPSNQYLYKIKPIMKRSYPEGNFGRNQLLESSIKISFPCAALTSDLHVSTVSVLHNPLRLLQPSHAKIAFLSGHTDIPFAS